MNIDVCDEQWKWVEQVESYLAEFRKHYINIKWETK